MSQTDFAQTLHLFALRDAKREQVQTPLPPVGEGLCSSRCHHPAPAVNGHPAPTVNGHPAPNPAPAPTSTPETHALGRVVVLATALLAVEFTRLLLAVVGML